MKVFTLTLVLVAAMATISTSQHLNFKRTYFGGHYSDARGIVATSDGGFLFTGLDKSHDDPTGDMYLTKVNAAGAEIWSKNYGLAKEDGGNFLLKTSDGGFLISGHTANSYGEECDGYVVKTDANGNLEWYRFIGTPLDDVCEGALEDGNGDFFLTGRIQDPDTRLFDAMLCKISPDGEVLFLKSIPHEESGLGYKIEQASDGGLLISGYSKNPTGNEDMYVVKCSPNGDVLWQKTFGTELHDRAFGLVPLPDGGCLVGGGASIKPYTEDYEKIYFAEFDKDGALLRFQPFEFVSGKGFLMDACKTWDGRFAFAGVFKKDGEEHGSPCLLTTDISLESFDFQVVAMKNESRASAICQNKEGDFAIAGTVRHDLSLQNILVAKVSLGQPATAVRDFDLMPNLQFPNPFGEATYIKLSSNYFEKKCTLYNMGGTPLKTMPFMGEELMIEGDNMPAGCYYFRITNLEGKMLSTGQIIKN